MLIDLIKAIDPDTYADLLELEECMKDLVFFHGSLNKTVTLLENEETISKQWVRAILSEVNATIGTISRIEELLKSEPNDAELFEE